MSLMDLPRELLCIIIRHVIDSPAVDDPAKEYRNIAATTRYLARLANIVLRDFASDRDVRFRHRLRGLYEYDSDSFNQQKCLKWLRAQIRSNHCLLHTSGDGNCYYEEFEPLVAFRYIYYPKIEFYEVDFQKSRCILGVYIINWHTLTALDLSRCSIDIETFAKLVKTMTHLTNLTVRDTDIELPNRDFHGPPLVRKSLKRLVFDNRDQGTFSSQYLDLPARRVGIRLKSLSGRGNQEETLSYSYLTRYKAIIESVDIYHCDGQDKEIDHEALFRGHGLDRIKCQAHLKVCGLYSGKRISSEAR